MSLPRTVTSAFLVCSAASAAVTFTHDVAPILYKKCTGCHHPNDVAPMSFLEYKSVRPWAKSIREAVLLKRMPPWFADPHTGPFSNDPSLTETEKRTIVQWIDQGAKEGDPHDLPTPPVYADGWRIGKPDAIFDIGEDHVLKGDPADEYTSFTIATNLTEGRWVRAVEIRPGNRKVVHHAHVSVIPPPVARPATPAARPAAKAPSFADYVNVGSDHLRHLRTDSPVVDDACAYTGPEIAGLRKAAPGALVSYLPGMPPDIYPGDSAKWIPAGARLRFTIHYHSEKSAEPITDRTSVGLIYAPAEPAHPLHRMDVDNNFFALPAGDGNHQVRQCATFDADSLLLSFTPHMHFRGKDARFEIERPGQAPETVLFVPHYDFNWQLKYQERSPVFVPKGSRLIITFHYDNSVNNAANPDPGKLVRWGEPSAEEMMSGWIDYIDAPHARVSESAAR